MVKHAYPSLGGNFSKQRRAKDTVKEGIPKTKRKTMVVLNDANLGFEYHLFSWDSYRTLARRESVSGCSGITRRK